MENKKELLLRLPFVVDYLSELEILIEKYLGFRPKLEAFYSERNNKIKIRGTENLVGNLGDTLVKTIFTKINIEFWGGDLVDDNSIWFNPKLSYEHPLGGSNGTDFLWDSLWFTKNNEWVEGRLIIK